MNRNKKEKQHTVPQFILRNFAVKGKIYTYDKHNGKSFPSNVNDSGCERGFYDFSIKVDDQIIEATLEGALCEIESNASVIIKKILDEDTVLNLSESAKDSVIKFLSTQMFRTNNVKQNFKSMPEQLRNTIRCRFSNLINDKSLEEKLPDFNEDDLNLYFDLLILDAIDGLTPYFNDLEWILVRTDEKNPFLIGDSPVVVYNELFHDKKESFGFSKFAIANKGSCVFFPLSPTRALWLVYPDVIKKYAYKAKEVLGLFFLGIRTSGDIFKMGKQIKEIADRREGFTRTKIVDFSSQEVAKYNFFEIMFAERKVFSRFSDFDQVEEMIKKNEHFKHGMRMRCC